MSVLDRLASEVRSRGGLLASEVSQASADGRLGAVVAAGPRAAGNEDDYALLARGVYPPPSQFEAWFPSIAHTPEHIARTVEAAAAAFSEIS